MSSAEPPAFFFFSSRRRHTRSLRDWSSDVCSSDLYLKQGHLEDALKVYEALLARRPGDARLQAKVKRMRGSGKAKSGQSVGAFLRSVLRGEGVAAVALAPFSRNV